MSTPRFYALTIAEVSPEAAGAVAISFDIPAELSDTFAFEPGQFLTLKATIDGQEVRRNYSISCPRSWLHQRRRLQVGIRPVKDGVFSNWAAQTLKAGQTLEVMPPDGRFVAKRPRALHRVGFASGSGITPILSMAATLLEESDTAKFTLVYGNRRQNSIMFNEALQDLKDRYADRFTMVHILSRQAQEVDLLQGRIDGPKVEAIVNTLLPIASMDEVFVCGPEAMMDAVQTTLVALGLKPERIRSEHFAASTAVAAKVQRDTDTPAPVQAVTELTLVMDGKQHLIAMQSGQNVLDACLDAGLDLPFSCKAGVCCACRAKVLCGEVTMAKNFTLEADEVAQGFVLTCQSHPTTPTLTVSFDDR